LRRPSKGSTGYLPELGVSVASNLCERRWGIPFIDVLVSNEEVRMEIEWLSEELTAARPRAANDTKDNLLIMALPGIALLYEAHVPHG
jgi:hypothetical protein